MAKHHLGFLSLVSTDGDAAVDSLRGPAPAPRRGVAQASVEVATAPADADGDQLARDIAEIERAAAALRKAEPALETWTTCRRTRTRGRARCGS